MVEAATAAVHPQVQHLLSIAQPEQRSPEWFQMRSNLLTASNVAAALGIKPYESYSGDPREDLLRKMVSGDKVFSPFLQHGVDFEDEAIEELAARTGETVRQVGLFVHPVHKWLGGSPDGLTESGCTVEAKCPQSRQITMGEIPHHYFPQVQVCMEICDLEHCWFVEYKPSCVTWPRDAQVNVVKVARDREWFAANLEAMHNCWLEIKQGKEDPDAFWEARKKKKKTSTRAPKATASARPRGGARKQQLQVKLLPCPIEDELYTCEAHVALETVADHDGCDIELLVAAEAEPERATSPAEQQQQQQQQHMGVKYHLRGREILKQ